MERSRPHWGVSHPSRRGEWPSLCDQSLWLLHGMAHCVGPVGSAGKHDAGAIDLCTQAAPPFVLPVMLPGVWGYVEGEEFSPKHPIGG